MNHKTNIFSKILLMTLYLFCILITDTTVYAVNESRTTICILDSGCNMENIEGWNYLDDNNDLSDKNGHGTIICKILQDTAPDVNLIMLKCFDTEDENNMTDEETEEQTDENRILRAIYDSVDKYHADAINMSWTLNRNSEVLHEAIQYAGKNGVLMLAAAGNLSFQTPLGSQVYPAGWDEVIGVAGADVDENGDPVSSLWYLGGKAVYVSADGNYEDQKGSSYAVPRVTAVVANYLIENPEADREKVLDYLKKKAVDAGEKGYDLQFGWGYIK